MIKNTPYLIYVMATLESGKSVFVDESRQARKHLLAFSFFVRILISHQKQSKQRKVNMQNSKPVHQNSCWKIWRKFDEKNKKSFA